jgi:histone H3/H4
MLTNVVTERMPPELRVLAHDDADKDEIKSRKHELESGNNLPGQKKQRVQDIADTVDPTIEIERPVEDIMLGLTDEYVEVLSQAACQLAKHRNATTVDRKDVQFAYEQMFGRTLPGFSSDAIRLDQARSSRRQAGSAQRTAKLKLVNDAKAAWRKEKEEAAKAASAAAITAEAAKALSGGVVNGEATPATATATVAGTAPVTGTATAVATPGVPNGTATAARTSGVNTPATLDTPAVIISAPPLAVVV